MRSASLYQFPDRMVICPLCRTEAGILITSEPYVVLPSDASATEIGAAVLEALRLSDGVRPTPTDWKALAAPRHEAAGVSSEAAFQRRALLVSVEQSGDEILLEPTHNGGTDASRGGFHPLPELRLSLPKASEPQAIGVQVQQAFGRCREAR